MISEGESVSSAAARLSSGRPDKASKTFRNVSAEALRLIGELSVGLLAWGGSGNALEVSFNLRYATEVGDQRADGAGIALMVGGRGFGGPFIGGHVVCHAAFHLLELGVDCFVEAADQSAARLERGTTGRRVILPMRVGGLRGRRFFGRRRPLLRAGFAAFGRRAASWPIFAAGVLIDALDRDAVPLGNFGDCAFAVEVQTTDLGPVGWIRTGHGGLPGCLKGPGAVATSMLHQQYRDANLRMKILYQIIVSMSTNNLD